MDILFKTSYTLIPSLQILSSSLSECKPYPSSPYSFSYYSCSGYYYCSYSKVSWKISLMFSRFFLVYSSYSNSGLCKFSMRSLYFSFYLLVYSSYFYGDILLRSLIYVAYYISFINFDDYFV